MSDTSQTPRSPEAQERKGEPARRPGQPGSETEVGSRARPDHSPIPDGAEPKGNQDSRRK